MHTFTEMRLRWSVQGAVRTHVGVFGGESLYSGVKINKFYLAVAQEVDPSTHPSWPPTEAPSPWGGIHTRVSFAVPARGPGTIKLPIFRGSNPYAQLSAILGYKFYQLAIFST